MAQVQVIVLGSGIAGLAAAAVLHARGLDVLVVEKSGFIGGLARTDEMDGFAFDLTGHFLHLRNPEVERFFQRLGVPLRRIRRQACVLRQNRTIPYPLQYNLWAIEPALRQSALDDLRQAHRLGGGERGSLAAALRSTWGHALTELFFRPYHEKLWGQALEALPADSARKYAVSVDLDLADRGCKQPIEYPGYNAEFFYPHSGRIGDLAHALAKPFRHQVLLNACPVQIDSGNRVCRLVDGRQLRYEKLVSTLPLPMLQNLLDETLIPPNLLRHNMVANVRVGFRGRLLVPWHWAYLADPEVPAYRVGFPPNVHPGTVPPGCASVSIEYGFASVQGRLHDTNAIVQATMRAIQQAGWIDVDEVLLVNEQLLSPAYVAHLSDGRAEFEAARKQWGAEGISLAGRFGRWTYYSMEEALLSGLEAAQEIDPAADLNINGSFARADDSRSECQMERG